MNILNIEHISKVYGDKKIFDNASFGIQENDKIGIVGINGTGKSTLLKMIAGLEEPDEGQIIRQNGLKTAYLSQEGISELDPKTLQSERTILSYMMEGIDETDWSAESEAKTILNELGITEHEALIEHLSGGQKKKVALAKTLVSSSDVLLLDEPTSHLDTYAQLALEKAVKEYQGAVLMVSHDFYTIVNCVDYILFVEDKGIRKIRTRSFRKMIYENYFKMEYLELEQKKKELEQRIDSYLLKHDFESARSVCERLEGVIGRMKSKSWMI